MCTYIIKCLHLASKEIRHLTLPSLILLLSIQSPASWFKPVISQHFSIISPANSTPLERVYLPDQGVLPDNYKGVWRGSAVQVNPNTSWTISLSLADGRVGTLVGSAGYPSIGCGAELNLQSVNADSIELLEDVTYGPCWDQGIITLTPNPDSTLHYEWRSPDGISYATGSISKVSTSQSDLPSNYTGVWKGSAVQVNPNASWPILMTLSNGGIGTIVGIAGFAPYRCGAELSLLTVNQDSIELLEDVTYGPCWDLGTITLTPTGPDTLEYRWRSPDGVSSALGSVIRVNDIITDPLYPEQWGLHKINIAQAWEETRGSESVVIAVIDTGVDYTHSELDGSKTLTDTDYDYQNNDDDARDDQGHGTHVAGIAAAETFNGQGIAGVCPLCRILPLKVGSDAWEAGAQVGNAIRYATDQGSSVINLSLGSRVCLSEVADAVNYAYERGVVLVAGSGKPCPVRVSLLEESIGVFYPARFERVIAIGASDRYDTRASFSPYGDSLDLLAPGVDILSTYLRGRYAYLSGTSMATPLVTGTAGLLLSRNPALTPAQVQDILQRSADDLATSGWDAETGWGRLNANQALSAEVVTVDPAPPATCPAPIVGAPQDHAAEELITLYTRLRDDVLSQSYVGQSYTRLYDEHGVELAQILITATGLRDRTAQFLTNAAEEFGSLLPSATVSTTLTQALYDEADALVTDLANAGDEDFQMQIQQVWADMRLDDYIGQDSRSIWEELKTVRIYLPLASR